MREKREELFKRNEMGKKRRRIFWITPNGKPVETEEGLITTKNNG